MSYGSRNIDQPAALARRPPEERAMEPDATAGLMNRSRRASQRLLSKLPIWSAM
jgi:hypothetical protein